MKQAIKYNFAGFAKNEANEIVHFTLQGDSDRLDSALVAIRAGTKKSSNIEVSAAMRRDAAEVHGRGIQIMNYAYGTNDRAFEGLVRRMEKGVRRDAGAARLLE